MLSVGEVAWSEPRNDPFLNIQSRYCRHFVNAKLKEPIGDSLTESLGLEQGWFTVKNACGELTEFQWWQAAMCDLELPGRSSSVLEVLAGSVPLPDYGDVYHHLVPCMPWKEAEVMEVLKMHG